VITKVAVASPQDVDHAVKAARKAFETTWGMNTPGFTRSHLMFKLAELMDEHAERLAALEALDNGKTFGWAKSTDVAFSTATIRYYAGWADKNQGKTIEVRSFASRGHYKADR
jgi:aldehyde dehydrogenase (NAD+)